MAASKALMGIAVPVVGAGLYAMTNRWSGTPAVQNEERNEPAPLRLARTASQKAKVLAESAQKAHGDYCESFAENAGQGGKKMELKKSTSRINMV